VALKRDILVTLENRIAALIYASAVNRADLQIREKLDCLLDRVGEQMLGSEKTGIEIRDHCMYVCRYTHKIRC
jgi:hypothetical protein